MALSPRRRALLTLTVAKLVGNTALRWVAPFLPTLERAFGTSASTLTTVMGIGELTGLSSAAVGRPLDRGHERTVFVAGMSAIALSSVLGLAGHVGTFAVSYALAVLGVTSLAVASHAWIGHRFAFSERGRAIGFYETSWALGLLVGVPLMALLIQLVGWRGPYVVLAVTAAVAAVLVAREVTSTSADAASSKSGPLPRSAWAPMFISASIAAAGIGTFVVSGLWLDRDYQVSTGGLGLVALLLGAIELGATSTVATIADRIGVTRSILIGLVVLVAGLIMMGVANDSRPLAVAGLATVFGGFEYGFVASLTLVTEAAPTSRARAIGVSNALGTIARATSVVVSGLLFDRFGIAGSIAFAGVAATVAMTLLAFRARR